MSAIPDPVRELVLERSGGVCEFCGQRRVSDLHHRVYRSRGGKHTAANIVALCGGAGGLPGGNHSGCHGFAHTKAGEEVGLSIRSGFDPLLVPLPIHGVGVVLLDDEGGWSPSVETREEARGWA